MRLLLATLSLAALAACAPPPYEQAQGGVGFDNYGDYMSQRSAQASAAAAAQRSAGLAPQQPILPPAADPDATPTSADLAAAGIGGATALATPPAPAAGTAPLTAIAPAPAAGVPVPSTALPSTAVPSTAVPAGSTTAQAPAPGPAPVGSTVPSAISDEQDFSAVASRETIQSDKARIEQNRAQYVQIQPGALPERPAEDASVIVQYAINAPNRLGQAIYKRSGLSLSSHEKACSRYASPEAAQESFLKSGGPQRDPKNLDPDGDGFACMWDPTPFQKTGG